MDTQSLPLYAHSVTISQPSPPPEYLGGSDEDRRRQSAEGRWSDFETQFAAQVLENVKHFKKEQKLTARTIAERLARAGWPLSLSSINGMLGKKGRHSLSITEILALASALAVPPINLILPIGRQDRIRFLPDYESSIYLATMGFIGLKQWRGGNLLDGNDFGGPSHFVQRMLESQAAEEAMYFELSRAMREIVKQRHGGTPDIRMAEFYVGTFRSSLWRTQSARKAVRAQGIEPDPLEPSFEWIDVVKPDEIDLEFLRGLQLSSPRMGDAWPEISPTEISYGSPANPGQ